MNTRDTILATESDQLQRYTAFINYRHVDLDRKWAKWLVKKLETYRAPGRLIKKGVPQRIGTLFRDDDEIPASSDLSGQIEQALEGSEYLIVICSPDTPKSKWVRKEIETFQKLGKGDRILPLLVDGEPRDSFPPDRSRNAKFEYCRLADKFRREKEYHPSSRILTNKMHISCDKGVENASNELPRMFE